MTESGEAAIGGERSGSPPSGEGSAPDELQPLAWSTRPIIVGGTVGWLVALVVTLLVPDLHTGDRSWWPWACVAGIALGVVGYAYLARGRGNASGAH